MSVRCAAGVQSVCKHRSRVDSKLNIKYTKMHSTNLRWNMQITKKKTYRSQKFSMRNFFLNVFQHEWIISCWRSVKYAEVKHSLTGSINPRGFYSLSLNFFFCFFCIQFFSNCVNLNVCHFAANKFSQNLWNMQNSVQSRTVLTTHQKTIKRCF